MTNDQPTQGRPRPARRTAVRDQRRATKGTSARMPVAIEHTSTYLKEQRARQEKEAKTINSTVKALNAFEEFRKGNAGVNYDSGIPETSVSGIDRYLVGTLAAVNNERALLLSQLAQTVSDVPTRASRVPKNNAEDLVQDAINQYDGIDGLARVAGVAVADLQKYLGGSLPEQAATDLMGTISSKCNLDLFDLETPSGVVVDGADKALIAAATEQGMPLDTYLESKGYDSDAIAGIVAGTNSIKPEHQAELSYLLGTDIFTPLTGVEAATNQIATLQKKVEELSQLHGKEKRRRLGAEADVRLYASAMDETTREFQQSVEPSLKDLEKYLE
jgi:hypothetical protein